MGRTVSGVRGGSDTVTTHRRPETLVESVPGPESAAGTVSRALPPNLTAVREARNVVQQVLGTWRAEDIYDDVALVASELVANALRHGMQVERRMVQLNEATSICPDGVRISLVSTGRHVICSVTDPSEAPPVRRIADPLAGSGRGLQLVESLSLCWGWTVLDGDADGTSSGLKQGKSVWAIFPLDLPRRRPQSQVVGAA